MPGTRRGAAPVAAGHRNASTLSARPALSEISNVSAPANSKPKKKRAADDTTSKDVPKAKRSRKTKNVDAESAKAAEDAANAAQQKPRLTTPDLEFDYDRSQLRDPRPTPGRVKRPRLEDSDVTEEWKQQFFIPVPEKPKGRLNSIEKDELHRQAGLLNPLATFHDLYVCHRKGREGSPSYDDSGFELDWEKVDWWMEPRPYNKRSMIRGMEKSLTAGEVKRKTMNDAFFVPGEGPDQNIAHIVSQYVEDEISKDLGVPRHQLESKHFLEWEQRGFEKKRFEDWWREPNEEEKKRMLKMLSGASLRKHL